MGFFDQPEVKCAAGAGLALAGFGLAIPFASEACTDVVEKIADRVESSAYQAGENFRQGFCEARESLSSWETLLGPVSPISTLVMRYPGFSCDKNDSDFIDLLKEGAASALPFAFGGVAGLGISVYLNQVKQENIRDLAETLVQSLATSVLSFGISHLLYRTETHHLVETFADKFTSNLVTMGMARKLHRVFEKAAHFTPEQLEQIRTLQKNQAKP